MLLTSIFYFWYIILNLWRKREQVIQYIVIEQKWNEKVNQNACCIVSYNVKIWLKKLKIKNKQTNLLHCSNPKKNKENTSFLYLIIHRFMPIISCFRLSSLTFVVCRCLTNQVKEKKYFGYKFNLYIVYQLRGVRKGEAFCLIVKAINCDLYHSVNSCRLIYKNIHSINIYIYNWNLWIFLNRLTILEVTM